MIWIASFPRSGNTFLRNVLFEVYGLASSTYHLEISYALDEDFESYPFVKTHLRPGELDAAGFDPAIPVVYLVRDGRDAICSSAHHRSNLIAPGSDLYQNMVEAIVADRGSHFGGWSVNVEEWVERADLVIRYEDLVADPIGQSQRIGQLIDLPPPRVERLPTFESMKFGVPEYGAGKHQDLDEEEKHRRAEKFFRRGKAGAWRDEMPAELQELFWSYHGESMERLGYTRDGAIARPHPDLDIELSLKLGHERDAPERPFRVLMEAEKLITADNDGVKRYQVELLEAMYAGVTHPLSRWKIDLYHHGNITPLEHFRVDSFARLAEERARKRRLHREKRRRGRRAEQEVLEPDQEESSAKDFYPTAPRVGLFLRLERALMASVPRSFVRYLERNGITALHDSYEFFRAGLLRAGALATGSALRLQAWYSGQGAADESESAAEPGPEAAQTNDIAAKHDIVHIPLKQHFRAFADSPARKVITIHDLTHLHFPDMHTRANVRNAQEGMAFAQDSGAELIAVSEATRQDVLEHTSVPPSRVHVVYEAADPAKFSRKVNKDDCRRVRRKYEIDFDAPYIICLSTLEPRKNLINTIRAFLDLVKRERECKVNLVIAGKRGWDAGEIYTLAKSQPRRIFLTGFIDDEDLAYLYSDALCLSYLSLYEGFGLPPLEAMRCGTPVVYGDNSSIREVVAQGGLPADPYDIAAIRQQYSRLLNEPHLRETLSRAALQRANQFSWRRAAIETLALYEQVIDA
ncbi:glycosyltransferase [Mangrovimicrobium sediminis]|uniref:Glycosyltransferase n=1 Tax=Mangrovimicrobium sediminis TaxID=2562682 RepID=A0A4Z0M1T7_9GAMM|nr:glycosyltransferase [Haliea sp. SAOS-164]TGD73501.1 glycosyltransferase [Haliea sp. SAOS-164]